VNRLVTVLQMATPFVWLGMVVAISGIETPLKFRAPGMTRALGLGVGRLVFRALNVAEVVLLAALTVTLVARPVDAPGAVLVAGLWIVLAVQVIGLRTRLDRRAQIVMAGGTPPRSPLHHLYVACEGLKIVGLTAVGILLASAAVG
jgi:hypothetical protein